MQQTNKLHTFLFNSKKLQNLKCFLNVFNSTDVKNNQIIDKIYHNDICLLLEYKETPNISTVKLFTKNGKLGYVFISNKKTQQFKQSYES